VSLPTSAEGREMTAQKVLLFSYVVVVVVAVLGVLLSMLV
jgi:hypothetical protein